MNWITALSLLGALLGWTYNEWQKRIAKIRSEKEARYKELITLVRSFGDGFSNDEKANQFILELQLCWMYCPDNVIQKRNKFLDSMTKGKKTPNSQEDIDSAKGELMLAIRKDLLSLGKPLRFQSRTVLTPKDFRDVVFRSQDKNRVQ